MDILAYFLAILIGVSIGLIGSGGSILTVPILVYVLHVSPALATAYSLFIVGFSSLVGGVVKYYRGMVDFRMVKIIGLPSIAMVFVTRMWIMPYLPDQFLRMGDFVVTKSLFLMVFFAVIMILASYSMIRIPEPEDKKAVAKPNFLFVLLIGIALGVVTGVVGAGGGFLIVPALILVMRTPVHKAIGTSMWVVAINSLVGFSGFLLAEPAYVDWKLISIFTAASILGIAIGIMISKNISGERLKKGFGYFILIMGVYILLAELLA